MPKFRAVSKFRVQNQVGKLITQQVAPLSSYYIRDL